MEAQQQIRIDKNDSSTKVKRILSYFPLRYYLCAFVIGYFLFANVDLISRTEAQILSQILAFFDIQVYYFVDSSITAQGFGSSVSASMIYWVYLQIPFFIFFPTIALTSRVNPRMRARLMGLGLLTYLVLLSLLLVTIPATLQLNNFTDTEILMELGGFLIIFGGYLMVEFTLFSTITLPKRVHIERVVSRNHLAGYATLALLLVVSFLFFYSMADFFKASESPFLLYTALQFYNLKALIIFGSFLSFLIYRRRGSIYSRTINTQSAEQNGAPIHYAASESYTPSITFLIPCRNEELIIADCIRSIDRACQKYNGKSEIIIVNDGSTDRTESIAAEELKKLKRATGAFYTVDNYGKAYALQSGLERALGEIIFRIDADSVIDEDAIPPIVTHFKDLQVGCVGGMILPMESRSIWQKVGVLMYIKFNSMNKRTQDIMDSILVQSGAYSVFRKDALLKIGGWAEQFGEDGEITNRLGRFGYKIQFEPNSVLYSDVPDKLKDFLHQRARWSIAFYHSRGRNMALVTDPRNFKQPRAALFVISLLSHAGGLVHGLALVSLVAALLAQASHTSFLNQGFAAILSPIPHNFVATTFFITIAGTILSAYFLRRYLKTIRPIIFLPALWFVRFLVTTLTTVIAMEIALCWSSKWKEYNPSAYKALREEMKRNVDPLHG
jgi:cellulose synthase/poly-beta-1,6-N-acetylglucosamine synthase-like glycosyltransferase